MNTKPWYHFLIGYYLYNMQEEDKKNLIWARQKLYALDLCVLAKEKPDFKQNVKDLICNLEIFLAQFRNTKDL